MLSLEECPLHVRNVAAALKISPTTIYKYELDVLIGAARERQMQRAKGQKKKRQRTPDEETIHRLQMELEQERERNKGLVTRIVLMEANAARLGWDPEELYRPLPKPLRNAPHFKRGKTTPRGA
ncbi:MAG TPA: hypothetical protein VKT82_00150 [Ktedonobacterales bacterium]|nr:hypothetical protein [Ktedonobacterales bacterium]